MRRLLALTLFLLPSVAAADTTGIQVQHAWSRPVPAGRTGVIYMTVIDKGAPDSLTGVSSPVATSAQLHESFSENGVMKMRPVERLPIAPGKPIVLAPASYHIMLMGLKQPLVAGSTFPVTLTFANGGQLTTTVSVAPPGAGASGMNHDGMSGSDTHGMSMGSPGPK